MDPVILTIVMFASLLLLMIAGMPLAFALGVVATAIVMLLWGPGGIDMLFHSLFDVSHSFCLAAIPPFLFMGIVLQKSGIGEELFDMVYRLMGGVSGGLALGVVVICAIFAAMVGLSGPATIAMGLIALPTMLKHGYDKRLVTGTIQAGGSLGVLIPPSVGFIMYAFLASQSTGRMFAAGVFPGLLLVALFMLYIFIRCHFQPHMGPPVPAEERSNWLEKLKSLKAVILPALLIFIVLGFIIFGVTSPTEAAAIGGVGALVVAAIHRTLSWKVLKEAVLSTGKLMGMIMWIQFTAVAFSKIYQGLGTQKMIEGFVAGAGLSPMVVIILMLFTLIVFGMLLDQTAICFLTIPLFTPIVMGLGFDLVWFGVLFQLCMEMGYITPPFGWNLFYMKAIVPPEITMGDLYMSIVPFTGLMILGLAIVVMFPQIALWLPNLLFGA